MDQVNIIKPEDCSKAAKVLADSFGDEFISGYLAVGDDYSDEESHEKNQLLLEYIVYAHIADGLALEVGNFGGVALWMPPGGNLEHWKTMIMSGMWKLAYKLKSNGRRRYFREFLPFLTRTKRECLQEDDLKSWYLTYLATSVEARGKGYSRRLVEYVTDIADKNNQKCYIESATEHSTSIYERYGFVTVKKAKGPTDEPPYVSYDIMIRDANSENHVESSNSVGTL